MSIDERTYYSDPYYVPGASPHKSVSPVDLTVTLSLSPDKSGNRTQVVIATLTMVTVSEMRDTFPVSTLARVAPVGFTRGHRITAGSLVFSVFDRSAFAHALPANQSDANHTSVEEALSGKGTLAFLDTPADCLPPFDIHMVYTTEGRVCYEGLRGVHIVNQGLGRSIETISLQESYSFLAQERIPLQPLSLFQNSDSGEAYQEKIKKLSEPKGFIDNELDTFQKFFDFPSTPLSLPNQLPSSTTTITSGSPGIQPFQVTVRGIPVTGAKVIFNGGMYFSQAGVVLLPITSPGNYPVSILPGIVTGTDNNKYRLKPMQLILASPGATSVDAASLVPAPLPIPISYG